MTTNSSSTDPNLPLTLDVVKGMMDTSYYLIYVDYRDSLDGCMDAIAECMEKSSADTLFEAVDSAYCDCEWEEVDRIREELKEKCVDAGYDRQKVDDFFADNEEAIRDEIYNRDKSDYFGDLLDNTRDIPVRINLYSNYDCINSDWFESQNGYWYEESYFGHMVDALNMNPHNVKKLLLSHGYTVHGRWPNKRSRNGKEWVAEKDFITELANSCCGANLLVFLAKVSVKELFRANFNLEKVIIPARNCCGLFSSTYGGGSMLEMKLRQDVTIDFTQRGETQYDRFGLDIDGHANRYSFSIRETYGSDSGIFGKKLKLTA